jgi:hypothetical protein
LTARTSGASSQTRWKAISVHTGVMAVCK